MPLLSPQAPEGGSGRPDFSPPDHSGPAGITVERVYRGSGLISSPNRSGPTEVSDCGYATGNFLILRLCLPGSTGQPALSYSRLAAVRLEHIRGESVAGRE